jgi:prepilin-type N-terminal cleavage/methylation domain-containing protein
LLLETVNNLEAETSLVKSNGADTMNSIPSRGFALIEVLVALVILSICLLGMAGLMAKTTRNNSDGGRLTEAITLIQGKLEELKATPPARIANNGLNVVVPDPVSNVIRGTTYTRSWMVVPDVNNTYRITVTVNWTDKTSHSISMVTRVPL